jgi:hypothetical protein
MEEIKMESNILINSLKNQFSATISMLGKIVEICPVELWNGKKSGYVFWQQLIHVFAGVKFWLRAAKMEYYPFSEINGKNIYPEFENDPEINLSKEDVFKIFSEMSLRGASPAVS